MRDSCQINQTNKGILKMTTEKLNFNRNAAWFKRMQKAREEAATNADIMRATREAEQRGVRVITWPPSIKWYTPSHLLDNPPPT
jgi:hypothetical protein